LAFFGSKKVSNIALLSQKLNQVKIIFEQCRQQHTHTQ
jgi:hypothetical protein